ncbi:TIGR04002 family protein [Pseudoflavonifractor sp. 524-17]|uniref:TIGR04002 family protein n=1 Tax=Pseudoflavonifractor sp. 524-17 TaxID=2304577 RepID=UPI001379C16D|nr:TIGR04002 family protein [Pseudoflavonifractor sp. 524-17]NCE65898.1 TIGR04002 family protein [Pseudoflavonifractor sp. 524-17]
MSQITQTRAAARQKLRLLVFSALFAALIAVAILALFHIPIPTGYIHLGDTFIYLAGCLLPTPYAVAAAAIGAGLADLLTYPMWVLPTLVIKGLVVALFTAKSDRFLCRRNLAAAVLACLLSPGAYALAVIPLTGQAASALPQFTGTLIQAVSNGVFFFLTGGALDACRAKARIASAL